MRRVASSILLTGLSVTLAVGLSACGSENIEEPATDASSPSATATEETPPVPEASKPPKLYNPPVDEIAAARLTVDTNGYFIALPPLDYPEISAKYADDFGSLNYVCSWNPDAVSQVPYTSLPDDFEMSKVVTPINVSSGPIWQAGTVTGETTVECSYTNPETGERITAGTIITVE